MTENIAIYLSTVNLIMFILIYIHSRFLERYKESLDELAGHLYDIQESLDNNKKEEGEDDDNRTRTEPTGE